MTRLAVRGLTVRQPWADAITHGTKRVENRTWPAPARLAGARVLIHAGAAYDRHAVLDTTGWPDTRGAVLAVATLTGCHPATGCCRPWGDRAPAWHWQLTDVHRLLVPVPCRGALGLWTPTPAVLAAVTAQLTEETR